ncbi:MAG: hypothetical protein U0746_18215 [Gemmataceae bacterium]
MGTTSSLALLACLVLAPDPVDFCFVQAAPVGQDCEGPRRRPDVTRAVVLIHGLRPHPFSDDNAHQPVLAGWEKPDSALVKALAADSDVYAIGYAQDRTIDDIAAAPVLARYINGLRLAGYTEVVLVGHSAGGLLARYYVENNEGGGATKLIQICSPNTGSSWGKLTAGVRQSQEPFLLSLTKEQRAEASARRLGKQVPPGVEMVCIVSRSFYFGDGLVSCASQWPRDLQDQGVRAIELNFSHVTVVFSKTGAKRVAELVREPQPRWNAIETAIARAKIVGKEK